MTVRVGKKKRNSDETGVVETPNVAPEKETVLINLGETTKKTRTISLFGHLDEEEAAYICNSLLYLKETSVEEVYKEPDNLKNDEKVEIVKPINFCISTWGGDALGMFAVYDLMRVIRKDCDINTLGIGKVMSAGVLLLAAGTKGNRQIGKNTRVMMHSVRGSHFGALHSLENEMKETRWIQNQHIKALVSETNMTERQLRRMLNKKMDVYLNAEEAVKLGIADMII